MPKNTTKKKTQNKKDKEENKEKHSKITKKESRRTLKKVEKIIDEAVETPDDFFPVIQIEKNGNETHTSVPNSLLPKLEIKEVKSDGKLCVTVGEEDKIYYMVPRYFEERVLDKNIVPPNADDIRKEAINTLIELKQSWVRFGSVVSKIHSAKLYKIWGFDSFCDYCDKELKLKDTTVYEIMDGVRFLKAYKPEVYNQLISGTSERSEVLPSYHSLYLLERKESKLEKENKLDELVKSVFEEGISTRELQKRLKEILGVSQKQELTFDRVFSTYRKIAEAIEQLDVPDELKEKAKELFEEMEKVGNIKG